MGTDIHLQVERFLDGKWEHVEPTMEDPFIVRRQAEDPDDPYWAKQPRMAWWDDRNYDAFGILAGVRRGYIYIPISEPRGLPTDLAPHKHDEEDEEFYFGDHSFSWLTARELAEYPWDTRVSLGTETEVLPRKEVGAYFMAFVEELKRLGDEAGSLDNVRIVFGFDS